MTDPKETGRLDEMIEEEKKQVPGQSEQPEVGGEAVPEESKLNVEQQKELIVRGRLKQKRIVFAAIPIVAIVLVLVVAMKGKLLVPNEAELVISNDSLIEAQILDLEAADAVYPGMDLETSVLVREVVRLVNAERIAAGLSPLQLEQRLQEAAQVRALEATEKLSHTRPDASSYRTAIAEKGITSGLTGENLGMGFETPEEFVEALKKSESHRACLLEDEYQYIGVGIVSNPEGGRYKGFAWCQLFAR